jgi:hypothetical protein
MCDMLKTVNAPAQRKLSGAGQPRQVIAINDDIKSSSAESDNYFAILPEWILYSKKSPVAICVYAVLNRYANQKGTCFPSRKTIAEKIGVSIKAVDRALKELQELGAVHVEHRTVGEGEILQYQSNIYHLITKHPSDKNDPTLGTKTTLPRDKNDTRGRDKNDTLIKANIKQSQLTIEIQATENFNTFWSIYPRKKGKAEAKLAFSKALKKTDAETILLGAKKYALERQDQDMQYTAWASTWLNQERWEDEPDTQSATPTKPTRFLTKRELDDQRTKEAFAIIHQNKQKELEQ